MSCIHFDKMYQYSFSSELVKQTRDLNKLLTLEIELSRKCNYKCRYCYSDAGIPLDKELKIAELFEVVNQAKELCVRTIVIIGGGEPLLYPHIKELIKYIFSKGIGMILFTNGSQLDREMADYLYMYRVFPVLKANGIRPKTMNWLCGVPFAYTSFVRALSNLMSAGYDKAENSIGISTVICCQNYEEIVPLWKWVRDNKMIPYFERVTPQGRAKNNDLDISSNRLKEIFDKLAIIDKRDYGIKWDSTHPPIAGSTCERHYYSLYVKSNGDVVPCSGIDLPVGNVRDSCLKDIIINSDVIQQLRHIEINIIGKCLQCDLHNKCYGCRGSAYAHYNDYLAEDPLCWRNIED